MKTQAQELRKIVNKAFPERLKLVKDCQIKRFKNDVVETFIELESDTTETRISVLRDGHLISYTTTPNPQQEIDSWEILGKPVSTNDLLRMLYITNSKDPNSFNSPLVVIPIMLRKFQELFLYGFDLKIGDNIENQDDEVIIKLLEILK